MQPGIKNITTAFQFGHLGRLGMTLLLLTAVLITLFCSTVIFFVIRSQAEKVPHAVLLDADSFMALARYQDADIFMQQALAKYGRQPDLLLRMGCIQSMLADEHAALEDKERCFAAADQLLREAAALNPKELMILWNRALLAFRQAEAYQAAGLTARAQACREEFLSLAQAVGRRRDWQPDLQLHLGLLAESRGDQATAIAHYIAEFNNAPDNATAYQSLQRLRQDQAAARLPMPSWYLDAAGASLLVLLGLGLLHRGWMHQASERSRRHLKEGYHGHQHQTG